MVFIIRQRVLQGIEVVSNFISQQSVQSSESYGNIFGKYFKTISYRTLAFSIFLERTNFGYVALNDCKTCQNRGKRLR